ncbi:MAG: HIT domain-containing protein [Mycobacteriales bacterium]
MADCIFCAIVAGEIPGDVVHESAGVIAFRDISPSAPTHVLVVTREHFRNVAEVAVADPSLVGEIAAVAGAVAAAEGVGDDWRLVFNTGAGAGQTVFHVHGHVLGGRPLRSLG